MLKKPLLLTASLLFSPISLAADPVPWDDLIPINELTDWSFVSTNSEYNSRTETFLGTSEVRIDFDKSGSKGLFFSFYPKKDSLECSKETNNNKTDNIIFYVNKQAIKGLWYCFRHSDTNEVYYELTSSTEAGKNFTVNAFKKSEYVTVEAKGDRYTFSADGFTAAWDAKGGDAL